MVPRTVHCIIQGWPDIQWAGILSRVPPVWKGCYRVSNMSTRGEGGYITGPTASSIPTPGSCQLEINTQPLIMPTSIWSTLKAVKRWTVTGWPQAPLTFPDSKVHVAHMGPTWVLSVVHFQRPTLCEHFGWVLNLDCVSWYYLVVRTPHAMEFHWNWWFCDMHISFDFTH